jgi:hypothetical protein
MGLLPTAGRRGTKEVTKTPKGRSKAHARHELDEPSEGTDEYELDAGVEPAHPDTQPEEHPNESVPDWRTVLEYAWEFMRVRDQQNYDRAYQGMIKLGIIKE